MTHDLRRQAEAFYDKQVVIYGRLAYIDALIAFAKAQRAAEVEAVHERLALGGHRVEYMHSSTWEIEYREVNDWLDQRQKEWET